PASGRRKNKFIRQFCDPDHIPSRLQGLTLHLGSVRGRVVWNRTSGGRSSLIRASSIGGSRQMPPLVRSWQSDCWRWPLRVTFLRDHSTGRQNSRVPPARGSAPDTPEEVR